MNADHKPAIRFKDFDNSWEQRKLADVTEIRSASRVHKEEWQSSGVPFFRSSDVMATLNGTENEEVFISEELYEKLSSVSGKLGKGDVLVTGGGSVGRPYIVPDNKPLYTKDADLLWIKANAKLYPYYVYEFFFSPMFRNYLSSVSHVGTIAHYTITQLGETPILLPTIQEQNAIGEFFQALDDLITLHQRKHEKLTKVKKSMLEKMFPKEGEKVPEIRFAGFTDDWEQRKFGEMADYKKGPFGSALKKDIFIPKSKSSVKIYEQQNAINKDWKLERYYITESYANELKNFETHAGDIIVSCAGTIGELYELPQNCEPGIINQALMRVRVNNSIVNKMFYKILFVNMIDEFSYEHSNGSAMKNIPPFADLKPMVALCPTMEEQEQVACCFSDLDHLITLHQRKLEQLQKIKKSMLEKMFV